MKYDVPTFGERSHRGPTRDIRVVSLMKVAASPTDLPAIDKQIFAQKDGEYSPRESTNIRANELAVHEIVGLLFLGEDAERVCSEMKTISLARGTTITIINKRAHSVIASSKKRDD